ncbi:hypothetical protein IHE44_0009837 [Lamprotornis superbus]|uniref:Uncharacterized protein n=1 Tax=Lamprotornis superbus TaxID=245042 RepID=A0A835TPG9_9PASS|nr:hypothetical protein IHE44_0009837 [Lamprotornis superbus]
MTLNLSLNVTLKKLFWRCKVLLEILKIFLFCQVSQDANFQIASVAFEVWQFILHVLSDVFSCPLKDCLAKSCFNLVTKENDKSCDGSGSLAGNLETFEEIFSLAAQEDIFDFCIDIHPFWRTSSTGDFSNPTVPDSGSNFQGILEAENKVFIQQSIPEVTNTIFQVSKVVNVGLHIKANDVAEGGDVTEFLLSSYPGLHSLHEISGLLHCTAQFLSKNGANALISQHVVRIPEGSTHLINRVKISTVIAQDDVPHWDQL